jgi:chromosome segregation ATPase
MNEHGQGLAPHANGGSGGSADLLALLEERVADLVVRYREARGTIDRLRGQIKERERRIGELNGKVYALGRARSDAQKRIDGVISEIQRLERAASRRGARARRAARGSQA